MGQSLVQIYVHLIYSTKSRKPFLKDPEFRQKLFAYKAGICKKQGCPAVIIGGVEDHVHLLCRLGKTIEIAKFVQSLKRPSSDWIKEESSIRNFYWQTGYGAFSISPGHVDGLTAYIRDQEIHHRKETFQEEFRRICKRYQVEIDERYVWD